MIDSAKFRKFPWLLLAVLVCNFLYPLIGHAETYQAAFPLPVPDIYSDAEGIHVHLVWVQDNGSDLTYNEIEAIYPAGTRFRVYGSQYQSMYLTTNQPSSGHKRTYNLLTGQLLTDKNANGVAYERTLDGIAYHYFLWVNNTADNGFFPASNIFVVDAQGTPSYYDIVWGAVVPTPSVYRSFTSEPVADDINRYFILAGEDNAYLYHIKYWFSELYFMAYANLQNTDGAYVDITALFYPVLHLSDSGLSFSVEVNDTRFLALINALANSDIVSYDIQITRYDLKTGGYIDSFLFQNLAVSQGTFSIDYDFDPYDDFDAVAVYGVAYEDSSISYHYNRLACTWDVDPAFEAWQSSMLEYITLIYNILSQQAEEQPTIEQDTSAVDEYESIVQNLQPTDKNGNKVDTAQEVESQLNAVGDEIESLKDGAGDINGVISDFIFLDPLLYVPLLVALAMGLVITILGKNKS